MTDAETIEYLKGQVGGLNAIATLLVDGLLGFSANTAIETEGRMAFKLALNNLLRDKLKVLDESGADQSSRFQGYRDALEQWAESLL